MPVTPNRPRAQPAGTLLRGPARTLTGPPRRLRANRVAGHNTHAASKGDPVWLFDLDNTLHDTSHAIFPQIDRHMTLAVQSMLQVDEAQANTLRERYWRRYGATMIGMVRHHGVDAREFLARSHGFDIPPLIRAERDLPRLLARLPGRRILLTNAPLCYATTVLRHLGILHLFDSLWGIEEMQLHGEFRPKPSRSMLRHVLAREGVEAHRAILIEDTLDNLRAARAIGMGTVYIHHPHTPFGGRHYRRPGYVDLRINNLRQLLLHASARFLI